MPFASCICRRLVILHRMFASRMCSPHSSPSCPISALAIMRVYMPRLRCCAAAVPVRYLTRAFPHRSMCALLCSRQLLFIATAAISPHASLAIPSLHIISSFFARASRRIAISTLHRSPLLAFTHTFTSSRSCSAATPAAVYALTAAYSCSLALCSFPLAHHSAFPALSPPLRSNLPLRLSHISPPNFHFAALHTTRSFAPRTHHPLLTSPQSSCTCPLILYLRFPSASTPTFLLILIALLFPLFSIHIPHHTCSPRPAPPSHHPLLHTHSHSRSLLSISPAPLLPHLFLLPPSLPSPILAHSSPSFFLYICFFISSPPFIHTPPIPPSIAPLSSPLTNLLLFTIILIHPTSSCHCEERSGPRNDTWES